MIKNIIKTMNLTTKEAQVYLASLKLGIATVQQISTLAKVNRITCYTIISKLMQKGILIETIHKKHKTYQAQDPDIIYNKAKQNVQDFKTLLPSLQKLKQNISHPQIKYYEGFEGVKAIYNDTLTSQTEILSFANSKELRENWPKYDEEYVQIRVKKKIFLRGIAIDDDIGRKVKANSKKFYRKIKLVPEHNLYSNSEINIYDNKVAYTSFTPHTIGLIIEDQNFNKTLKSIFEIIWNANL